MRFSMTARFCAFAVLGMATATTAWADTASEQSCRLLAVLGSNDLGGVAPALAEIAAHWPEPNRTAATQQLSEMLGKIDFAGGNVYEIGRLGEDLVEHLVVLRLAEGETAGMQLSYEWTPAGLALTQLDFKREYTTELALQIPANAQPQTCP